MVGKSVLNNEGKATSQREVRPVWNNAQRVNHQNFTNNLTHPHPRRNFVPSAVLTNSGKVPFNVAKQSFPRAAVSNSIARSSRPTVNGAKPCSIVFHKSHSPVKMTFNQRAAPKNSDLKEKVNTAKVNNVTTAGPKATVSVVQGHEAHAIKASAGWILRHKQNLLDHVSKDNSGSWILKRFDYEDPQGKLKSVMAWVPKRNEFSYFFMQGNPQHALKDQGIVDNGCSRHMTLTRPTFQIIKKLMVVLLLLEEVLKE
ncbi:hypothetical protein Tco_1581342, partial [Tanacetum coccineum]